jgi:dTDP-4-amino-4,6-dideoxygalactose transaminase
MILKTEIEQVPFIDLKAQYRDIASEIDAAMAGVIKNTAFILGEEVKLFENEFADYCQASFAVGVDSGTSALELALRAYGIGPGDEVITAANTFIATALAISYTGAKPVLVDIDPHTYAIDVIKITEAITNATKAIIPVHLYGNPVDMDPILEIAKQHDLILIEDACQAHGAKYKNKRVGGLGDAAAFSFYPAKNLGAFGDGGIIVTNNEEVANTIRMLRDVGQRKKYYHEAKGFNHRLDALQAAVLRVKLKYLDEWNEARRSHAEYYNNLFKGTPVITPGQTDASEAVYHLYIVRVDDRDGLMNYLAERKVFTGIHYPIPIHLQEAYQDLDYEPGDFPITEEYADQILSLPMYAELTPEMVEFTVRSTLDYLSFF